MPSSVFSIPPPAANAPMRDRLVYAIAMAGENRRFEAAGVEELRRSVQNAPDWTRLPPAVAKDVLALFEDPKIRQTLGIKRGEQEGRLASLRRILGGTVGNFSGPSILKPLKDFAQPGKLKPRAEPKLKTKPRREPQRLPEPAPLYRPIVPRDYQQEFFSKVEAAFVRSRGDSDSLTAPRDRGYGQFPWQTGKSKSATLIVQAAATTHFPGKKTVILSPNKIIARQFLKDLEEATHLRVTRYDAEKKDLSGDVIVASAFTLVREENLKRLNPDDVGLVVIDEMPFVLTATWQKIMHHLGFVDAEGRITLTRGKFALGLGASASREDGRSVAEFFGDTYIDGRGFHWFITNGHLHRVLGRDIELQTDAEDVSEDAAETIVSLSNIPQNRELIIQNYVRYLNRRKTLIFAGSIEMALALEKDFNRNANFGNGYARAVVGDISDRDAGDIVDDFNNPHGKAKVLISIHKLTFGARLEGVEGVLHVGRTNSWQMFTQRTARGLGIMPGETQRAILVLTLGGKGHPLDKPQSAATMMGNYNRHADGEEYDPLQNEDGENDRKQKGVDVVHGAGGGRSIFRIARERSAENGVVAFRFREIMRRVLLDIFDGDVEQMARAAGVDVKIIDAYMFGVAMPNSYMDTIYLARRVGADAIELADAWFEDMTNFFEEAYPIPADFGPAKAALVRLLRAAVAKNLDSQGLLAVQKRFAGEDRNGDTNEDAKLNYSTLRGAFNGSLPVMAGLLKAIYDFIIRAEILPDNEVRSAIGRYIEEAMSGGRTVGQAYEYGDGEVFDHGYIDALDEGERAPIGIYKHTAMTLDPLAEVVFPSLANLNPLDTLIGLEARYGTALALATLPAVEEYVFRQRFGLSPDPKAPDSGVTLSEIGEHLGFARSRVGFLEARGLRMLRRGLHRALLREVWFDDSARLPGQFDPPPADVEVLWRRLREPQALGEYKGKTGYYRFAMRYFEGDLAEAYTGMEQAAVYLGQRDEFKGLGWVREQRNIAGMMEVRKYLFAAKDKNEFAERCRRVLPTRFLSVLTFSRYVSILSGNFDRYLRREISAVYDNYDSDLFAWFGLMTMKRQVEEGVVAKVAGIFRNTQDAKSKFQGESGFQKFHREYFGDSINAWFAAKTALPVLDFLDLKWPIPDHRMTEYPSIYGYRKSVFIEPPSSNQIDEATAAAAIIASGMHMAGTGEGEGEGGGVVDDGTGTSSTAATSGTLVIKFSGRPAGR